MLQECYKSLTMTLQYMGHYEELNDAIKELTKEESEIFVEKITTQIENNKNYLEKMRQCLIINLWDNKLKNLLFY